MVWLDFTPGRHLFSTYFFRQRAAGAEAAARRRVHRAGHVAFQNDPLAFLFNEWVRHWHCGEQRLGIRVQRVLV